jgi:proton glutamate symport protein
MKKLGRVGSKVVGMYLITTLIAVLIGVFLALVIQPGTGITIEKPAKIEAKKIPSMVDWLLNIVPTNVVKGMAETDVLQIIFFALFLGVCLALLGDRGKPVVDFFDILTQAVIKMTGIVMEYAPYAVFVLMAWVAGKYGLKMLLPLGKLIIAVYIGCILQILITYSFIVKVMAKKSMGWFLRGVADAMTVAFTTCSSAATLPVTMRVTDENLKVKKSLYSFSLPLGCTINMDGTSIYEAIAAIFTAQLFGISLGFSQYVAIIVTATLASIGAAGVPGAGLIMMTMVLTAAGLPLEVIGIIAGVDRIMDMVRTMVNITGDAAVTVAVARSEGEFQEEAKAA